MQINFEKPSSEELRIKINCTYKFNHFYVQHVIIHLLSIISRPLSWSEQKLTISQSSFMVKIPSQWYLGQFYGQFGGIKLPCNLSLILFVWRYSLTWVWKMRCKKVTSNSSQTGRDTSWTRKCLQARSASEASLKRQKSFRKRTQQEKPGIKSTTLYAKFTLHRETSVPPKQL